LAGYVVAFAAVTWPLIANFDHSTYGGEGDGWALIWQTRFRLEHGLSYFSPTFGHDIGWPVGGKITSSLLLSNASIELPHAALLALGVPDVVAFNLIVLAAAVTSSLAMYAVLRRLECRAAVAFWGGLVYLLAPWHLTKLSIHPTLGSMAALPVLLLGLVEWTRRPGLRSGALVVGAAALATYTHAYYGIATGVMLLTALPVVLIGARRRGLLGHVLPQTAVLAGVLALVPIPLAIALAKQSSVVSTLLDRPLYLFDLAAKPSLLLVPSVDNPLFGGLSRHYFEGRALLNEGEVALYVGLLTLALAIVAVIAAVRFDRDRLVVALAAVMTVDGLLLAAPALVHIPLLGATVRMPVAYLNDALSFISTPARFFALTLTGLVVLGGLGLQFVTTRVPRAAALPLVAVACVISSAELPFRSDRFYVDTRPTAVVKALKERVPDDEPVAQYPSAENFYLPIARQLFYQLQHGHPLLNGAAATSIEDSVRLAVEDPSDAATPGRLALLGFKYAAYDRGQAIERAALIGRPQEEALGYQPPRGFEVLERLADGSLLMRVTARPAEALVSIGTGFTRAGRWLTKQEGTMLACATAPGVHRLRFRAGGFAKDRWITIGDSGIIIIGARGERTHTTQVRLRRGWQLLRVRLVGTRPTRPSDVIPGEPDSRPLSVSIGPIGVKGPRGPSRVCSQPTRLRDVRGPS